MTTVLAPSQREKTSAASTRRRTVNQTLCAATHVAEGFADYTVRIVDGRPRAGTPSLTEDPVALLRHATAARRLRCSRDVACCLITLAVGGVVVGRLAASLGYGAAVSVVAGVVAGWLGRRRLSRWLREWCAWAWRSHWDRRRSGPLRWVVGLAISATLAIVLVLRQPVLWNCVGVVLLGLGVGWLVIVGESVLAHRRAAAVVAEAAPEPRQLAAPLRHEVEKRVDELANANVIAYAESRASAPFVGNGFIVRPWKVDIDLHRRASDGDDDESAFTVFDIIALHERLEDQFLVENAVESTATRKVEAGHRLYVNGRKIKWGSDLLEADRPVPRSRVDWDYLAEELKHPERADDQRVYFYLQETCRDGEIGVCILVRPLLQSGRLSIEFVPLVIPPVHPDVESLVANLPTRMREHVGRAVRIWTPRVPAMVFAGPVRCALRMRERLWRLSARARWRLAARYGWFYDLGAVMSVREGVCWREPDEFDHFVIRDLIRINDQLRDRLITSIKAYLSELGIDTEHLEMVVKITNIQNWNVGNVRADMVGFGNNNTFGNPGRDVDGGADKG